MATIGALALVFIGAGTVAVLRRRDPRRLGRKNLEQHLLTQTTACAVCGQPTEPFTDLLVNDAWFHRACFDSVQP